MSRPRAYRPTKACHGCHGNCCKGMPGCAMPEDCGRDFDSIRDHVVRLIRTGRWTLDCWEGDPRPRGNTLSKAYYLRPATKGNEGKVVDFSWGGECTFLASSGCELMIRDRPSGCRLLQPQKDLNCISHGGGKKEAGIAWLPYDLEEILDILSDEMEE